MRNYTTRPCVLRVRVARGFECGSHDLRPTSRMASRLAPRSEGEAYGAYVRRKDELEAAEMARKQNVVNGFVRGKLHVVVANDAFGMGSSSMARAPTQLAQPLLAKC